MLSWLSNLFERIFAERLRPLPPPRNWRHPDVHVSFDETYIRASLHGGPRQEIRWAHLGRVCVNSICGESDLVWVLSSRDGRVALSVPMGAVGEAELVRTMQARLHGFDNMAVIEAMSSADDAEFQVWPPRDITAP